jgi:L-histidine N-alpha-methyltransferase
VHLGPDGRAESLRRDALAGLTASPKALPPKWFYDERGSQLFSEITRLPEYYLTRRERLILAERANEIVDASGADTLVELGSGTSEKTRLLLDAMDSSEQLARFVAVDVSEATLRESAERIADEYPGLEVHAVVGDLEQHLDLLPRAGRRLVVFLGSSIGNFAPAERAAFLAALRAGLHEDDSFLLGTDLVKDVYRLEAAYNDADGVTAAFNLNVLSVLNRELDADFVPERFEHVARWDAGEEWIEMRLRSRAEQTVRLGELGIEVRFADGEELRTEISAKFRRERVDAELRAAGLEPVRCWTDPVGDFALTLAVPARAQSRS